MVDHPSSVGTWTYNLASVIYTTNCVILPSQSQVVSRSIINVACIPQFDSLSKRMPNDGNPVRISIPYRDDGTVDPALDAAVDAAISRWTTALSPTLSIPLTKVYNVTCGVFDNHCAQILIQNPPNRPDACAETQSYPGSDGVWNQSARTYVRQSYTGGVQTFSTKPLLTSLDTTWISWIRVRIARSNQMQRLPRS
jgi:hypothetical protein